MPELLVTCPRCQRPVKTGIVLPSREAVDSSSIQEMTSSCPRCFQNVIWDKEDAYLEGETPK
jgi:endogenous inhibitor of DNA gyrase (YacG/DUF329 family)